MKTGMTRAIDRLGRVVLPMEIRRSLKIEAGDCLAIETSGSAITLRKAAASCNFCGSSRHLREFRGGHICLSCENELRGV